MTSINTRNDVVTLINVFTVEPARQQELVDLLTRATDETIRYMPGFVSATIHKSLDGVRVTNYAQWRSRGGLRSHAPQPGGFASPERGGRARDQLRATPLPGLRSARRRQTPALAGDWGGGDWGSGDWGSGPTGAVALGALALGACAIGSLAIGRLAIGALALRRAHAHRLAVDEVSIGRLVVGDLVVDRT